METRLEKGKQIAKAGKVREKAGTWLVPSQSRNGTGYVVKFTPDGYTCDCPDYEFRHQDCKHIYAVCVVVTQRETVTERVEQVAANGAKTVTTKTVTVEKRVTYPQNWPAYNKAQTEEKHTFLRLLADLCASIEEPAQPATGRRHLPLRDLLFCAALKVYSTVSGRRAQCDLQDACDKGYIARVPHFNSVFNTFEREDLTAILERLIVTSSAPLAAVEQDFAVDSTGLTTTRFVRWYDAKYGEQMAQHEWIKLHLMCGVKTNIVTSVEVSGRNDHDSPFLIPLVNDTAQNFTLKEVSADKAYSSRNNLRAIRDHRAVPYIPFKISSTGTGLVGAITPTKVAATSGSICGATTPTTPISSWSTTTSAATWNPPSA